MEEDAMSKRHMGTLATLLFAGAILAVCAGAPMTVDQSARQIAVYFSPHGGCTDAIVRELDGAALLREFGGAGELGG
jgi:hypothetical protein